MADDYSGSTSTSGSLSVGKSTSGNIETAYDTDWFRIQLVAGQTYRFGLTSDGSKTGLADPFLGLYNSSGSYIRGDDDSGEGLYSLMTFTATYTGTYYLEASGYDNFVGTYTLSATNFDNTNPTVSSFSPSDGATGVSTTTNVVVTFSESIQRGSGTIVLRTLSGTTIESFDAASSGRLSISGSTLTIDPTSTLASGTEYRVDFASGTVRDLAGNSYAGTTSYNFTTAASSGDDYGQTPGASGSISIGASRNGTIGVEGDRDWFAVNLTAGQTYTFTLNSTGGLDPYLALYNSGSKQLAYDDDSGEGLNSQLTYTAAASGVHYLEASGYSKSTGGYTLIASGSTPTDNTAPVVTSFSPADESGSVAVGTNIVVTFSEAVVRGSGTITLKTAGGTVVETFGSSSSRVTVSGSTLTIDPSANLSSGTSYRVEFASGSVRDASGNNYAGTTAYNFTTATAGVGDDYGASAGSATSLSIGSSKNGTIETSGDRDWFAVQLVSGQTYEFRLNAGSKGGLTDPYLTLYNSGSKQVAANDDSGGTLNSLITYTAPSSGTYYVEASGLGYSTGGYAVSASSVGSVDRTAPVVTAFSPSDEATGVAVNSNILVTFSEPVQRGTGTIVLKTSAGTVVESFNAATSGRITINGNTLAIDPTSALAGGTGYRVEFAAGTVKDIAGNNYAGTTAYNFSTASTAILDDYGSTASTASTVAIGGTRNGVIEVNGDRDWFAVQLTGGKTYTFALTSSKGGLSDPYLTLYNSGSKQVASDDDSGGNLGALMTYTAPSTGTYYVEARGYGSAVGAYQLTATSGSAGGDTSPPQVLSFSPADESMSVAVGSNIVLSFNESVQRGSGTILLKTSSGTLVESFDAATSGRISVSGSTVTIDPTATLASGTGYRVEFASGNFRDLSGNAYAGTTSYNFTTAGDLTPPTPVAFSPADEAGSVAVSTNIVVTFSEAIARGTGTINLYTTSGSLVESFNAATSSRLTLSGSTLTIDPSANLAAATGYRVEFAYGAIRDLAGNPYAGTTAYNFTTASSGSADDYAGSSSTTGTVSPGGTATGRIETDGDRDWFRVQLNAGQSYTFRLDPASSGALGDPYLTLYNSGGKSMGFNDDGGGNLASLLAYTPTASGTYYLEARAYSSGTGNYVLSVAGSTATDSTPPVVTAFSPSDEASGVAVNSNIVATFSEPILRGFGTIVLKTAAGAVIESFDAATSGRLSISGSTLTIDPTASLAAGTGYRVEFAAGTVRDVAGNIYAGTTSYNFTTGGDTTAPVVLAFTPADEATAVPVTSHVSVTFSEAVQRGSGTILLKNASGAIVESYDSATSGRITVSGATLTIDPTFDLSNATGYRVEFSPGTVRDLAGNAYAGTTSYNFTTVALAVVDDYLATASTTGVVAVGGSSTGNIERAGDKDWFRVNLTAGTSYTFALNAAASNGLADPYLSLFNSSGTLLNSNDDANGGRNSMFTFTAPSSGAYYLEAKAYSSETGAYSVSATAAAGPTTPPAGGSGFTIQISFTGASQYEAYFTRAAARWAEIITGDLPDIATVSGLIDDLRINASVVTIDGEYNVLGRAAPTALRGTAEGGLPYLGMMEFDVADVAWMVQNGIFDDVVLHEMGHVLGINTSMFQRFGLVSSGNIYSYVGASGVQAYDSLLPGVQTSVPLETQGGPGSAASHWAESLFDKELMTPQSESLPPMPISIVTIGALDDLGYVVNYAAADPFSF